MALRFRNKHSHSAIPAWEEIYLVLESQIQTSLIFGFNADLSLQLLADWSLTVATQMLFRWCIQLVQTPWPLVRERTIPTECTTYREFLWPVIKNDLSFPERWKILLFVNSRSFMKTSIFKDMQLDHWHLLHRCYFVVVGLSVSTDSRILFS
jgi:hypothetical protein